jgi:hypothetical protein
MNNRTNTISYKISILLTVFALCFMTFSCRKDKSNNHKLSGAYEIEKYEIVYYKNGAPDSTVTHNDFGVISLYESLPGLGAVWHSMPFEPQCWTENHVGGDNGVRWETDEAGPAKSITFWTTIEYSGYVEYYYRTFTIENKALSKKMRWYYVACDSDKNISRVESLYVKRK